MKHQNERNSRNRSKKPRRDDSVIGVVRVFSNPGPDAEDRLRRALSLMIKYATRNREDEPGSDSREDGPPTDDPTEAEA